MMATIARYATFHAMPTHRPLETYQARVRQFTETRDRHRSVARTLMHARVISFVLVVVLALGVERRGGAILIAALVLSIAGFIALVAAHRRESERERWNDDLARVNKAGLHRLRREWDALPVRSTPIAAAASYAADLDLYGRASLTQILGPTGSATGAAALDAMLLGPADVVLVHARQEAVRELSPMNDFRDAFAIHATRTSQASSADVERFLAWAETASPPAHPLLPVIAWLLPAVTWLLMFAELLGFTEGSWWLLALLVGAAVYWSVGARARQTFDQAFGREAMFAHYPALLSTITDARFDSAALVALRGRLVQNHESAGHQLQRLGRLMHLADIRTSSIHVPIFLLTMWDLHLLRSLETWQRTAGRAARDWLVAAGELEALTSLATLAHDQPDWAYARVANDADAVVAEALGHPLIRDDVRVTNNVVVGPPGSFLLVTGSNMSGKSTLLRSLGINIVLAHAGAPSCARSLEMPPLEIGTSIRVQDSLARGVSYFMAELERLKQIVDAAHSAEQRGVTLLFLLDEILHGTNTAERRIAARRVIRHLLNTRAIGAVTTHDLELADDPALADAARLVHFREHFVQVDGSSTLAFDYILNPGIATSTNALELMKLVGLDEGAG
jgi:hypothetical protein